MIVFEVFLFLIGERDIPCYFGRLSLIKLSLYLSIPDTSGILFATFCHHTGLKTVLLDTYLFSPANL